VISLIVPAHNEEFVIGETLAILRSSAESLGVPFEIIVAADACTDRTVAIAREAGATVVEVDKRQIAAVRNAGAKAARGDLFVFVDADTHVPAATLEAAVTAIEKGAVGGGAELRLDPGSPLWGQISFACISFTVQALQWSAGCFLFVGRKDFEAVGGFDERYFVGEEIVLSRLLKKRGQMAIVRPPVTTSGRKTRLFGFAEHLGLVAKFLVLGDEYLRKRENFDIWYGGRRES